MGTRRSRRSWADTVHLGQRNAGTVKRPPARRLRLLRPRLPALGSSALQEGEAGPLGSQPLPRALLERAASKVADSTASEPPGLSPTRTH